MARGILAEMQRQVRTVYRESQKADREAEREFQAAVKREARAIKAERALEKKLAKAQEAERKRLEKEEKLAHIEAMNATAERKNAELEQTNEAIDSLLAATLSVDDYVDLETLRMTVQHPEFDRADLEKATKKAVITKPVLMIPEAPKGLLSIFKQKKHLETVEQAKTKHEAALIAHEQVKANKHKQYLSNEDQRVEKLKHERERYNAECAEREAAVEKHNEQLDQLIANLGYGTEEAIQEYVGIVLANSIYPEEFTVDYEFKFASSTAELKLKVLVPAPETLPAVKLYRYHKAADEIVATAATQKTCKDRYAGAVYSTALRTFHEIFEADRRGLIRSIDLTVRTRTIHPATGVETEVTFVASAAERDSFMQVNLSNVVPLATLEFLGSSVSKNPYGLMAAKTKGVRKS